MLIFSVCKQPQHLLTYCFGLFFPSLALYRTHRSKMDSSRTEAAKKTISCCGGSGRLD